MVNKKVLKRNLEEGVKDVICDICNVKKEKLTLKTNLRNDLGIDSIDVAEIMFAINQKFNIDIFKENIESIDTLESLIERLNRKINV